VERALRLHRTPESAFSLQSIFLIRRRPDYHRGEFSTRGDLPMSAMRPTDEYVDPVGIHPPANDLRERRDPAYIARLAADIKARGQRHPAYYIVRPDGEREMVAGEHRRLACLQAGLKLWAKPLDRPLKLGELLLERFLENDMSSDFSDIERISAYAALMQENGWSQAELAKAVHKSPALISKAFRRLKGVPETYRDRLGKGEGMVSPATATCLARITDDSKKLELFERASKGLLTRDAAEVLVANLLGKNGRKPKPVTAKSPQGLIIVFPGDWTPNQAKKALTELSTHLTWLVEKTYPLSLLSQLLRGGDARGQRGESGNDSSPATAAPAPAHASQSAQRS
jgi:ParB/RepB/Spo0J family partition protein